jgi:hypothetical protein
MPPNTAEPHLCARQKNISQLACCQFVLLLNDTTRLPLCDENLMAAAENLATLSDFIFGKPGRNGNITGNETIFLRKNIYTTPAYLSFPSEVPEDHITFLFGIMLLISLAVCCTVFILKLTKPKFSAIPSTITTNSYGTSLNYDVMMFLPHSQRRSSVLFFLRGITCRSVHDRSRQTSLSVVSNSRYNIYKFLSFSKKIIDF